MTDDRPTVPAVHAARGGSTAPEPAPALDALAFRRAIGQFATGVTVITVRAGEAIHGMTANSVTSVSLDPLLILVCVDRRARMCALLQQAGEFAVNVLSARQEDLSRHFAGSKTGPEPATLAFDRDEAGADAAPFIHGALAAIRCRVERIFDGGDHIIALGRVSHFHQGPPGDPLLYFAGRYRFLRELSHPAPPDFWHNDAVQVYHDMWTDTVDEGHPIA